MNKVILIGQFTRDTELRYSQSNQPLAFCNFTIAVNRKNKNGGADFINCVAFGKIAENIDKFFKKGSTIIIEGRIENDSYTDKETGKRRVSTKVITESFYFPGEKKEKQNNNSYGSTNNPPWEDNPFN